MQVFRLVPLTGGAPQDELAHQLVGVSVVEGGTQVVEGLLHSLMARAVGRRQDLGPERGRRRDEDAAVVQDEAVHQ